MTLAVKYCGGCNPRYDRIAQVNALQKRFPEITIADPDGTQPDFVLVVCGCPSQCVNHAGLTARYMKAVVCSAQDFGAFTQKLEAYLEGTKQHGWSSSPKGYSG